MCLCPLGQLIVADGDHNRKERLCEDFLDIVNEECLEGPGALGEYRARGVGGLEVLGNVVRIREDLGCLRIAARINYNWEAVDSASVGPEGAGRRADGA